MKIIARNIAENVILLKCADIHSVNLRAAVLVTGLHNNNRRFKKSFTEQHNLKGRSKSVVFYSSAYITLKLAPLLVQFTAEALIALTAALDYLSLLFT